MILVDTSVWIDHLRRGNDSLRALLLDGTVLGHPFVLGELACGDLRNRREILGLLGALPGAATATDEEVLHLVEEEQLHGLGIGWVDAHLLASSRLTACLFWTLDRALARVASDLRLSAPRRQ